MRLGGAAGGGCDCGGVAVGRRSAEGVPIQCAEPAAQNEDAAAGLCPAAAGPAAGAKLFWYRICI